MNDTPETESEEITQPNADPPGTSRLTKQAGLFALIFTTLLAIGIIALVFYHVSTIEAKNIPTATALELAQFCPPSTCPETTLRLLMEQDAQNLRTDRFRNAITIRLVVHVVAEVIALVLVVLGAVLIFDRIESDRIQGGGFSLGTTPDKPTLKGQFFSSFPGLFLCFCGTGVIIYSIWVFSWPESRLTIYDEPVFVQDLNSRFAMSGQKPGTQSSPGQIPVSSATRDAIANAPKGD